MGAESLVEPGELDVVAGGVAEHDATHDAEPGGAEHGPVEAALTARLGEHDVRLLLDHGPEALGQAVHRTRHVEHRLVEAAPVGPSGPLRDEHGLRLEVRQRCVLQVAVGGERLRRLGEHAVHVVGSEDDGLAEDRQAHHERPVAVGLVEPLQRRTARPTRSRRSATPTTRGRRMMGPLARVGRIMSDVTAIVSTALAVGIPGCTPAALTTGRPRVESPRAETTLDRTGTWLLLR
jgi:hypothetical protein